MDSVVASLQSSDKNSEMKCVYKVNPIPEEKKYKEINGEKKCICE